MTESTVRDPVPAEQKTRFLVFSRFSIAVMLLLIAGGVGAVIYVTAMGGELYTVEEKPDDSPFGDELNFQPDEVAMYTLSHIGGPRAADAIDKVVAAEDKRFIPVLIEMLEAGETQPFVFGAGARRHIFALRELANDPNQNSQSMESLSRQWRMWYAASNVGAPEGFTAWKGKLYSRLDPRFEGFFKNEYQANVRIGEILYGGVKVDAIPSLDRPAMIPADKADYLQPDEPVFGIEVNGDARAFPRRILDWHEVVNDDIGGTPVVLTYCPLSGAGIAYEARLPDGTTCAMGTSGLVYRSNKLMYDHETNTLWNQLTGRAALGPLADSNLQLKPVPIVLTTWKSWRQSHPETTVLDLNTGFQRRYEPSTAYGVIDSSDRIPFTFVPPSDVLPLKARVFGVRLGNSGKAYSVTTLAERKVVNDSVDDTPIVLVAPEGTITVSGKIRRRSESQIVSYDAGGTVRAYERGEQTFAPGSDAGTVVDAGGKLWKITETALVGPEGQSLNRVAGFQCYWFAWQQFHTDSPVYH